MMVAKAPRETDRTVQPAAATRGLARRKLMVVRLARQAYGIPLEAVQEVVPLPLLTRPPGMPPILAGVFSLAGSPVAVLKLERLFAGSDHSARLYTPLVVLRSSNLPLALMVDEAVGIESVAEGDMLPLPETSSFNECAEGVAVISGVHVIVVSPERILTRTEQQRIAAWAALEQSRLAMMEGGGP